MKDLDYKIKGKHVDDGLEATSKDKRGFIFQQLELTMTGLCNRFCSFCPRTDPKIFKSTRTFLDKEKLKEIFMQLGKYNYSGKVSMAGFGEPFTHPKLDLILKDLKKYIPNSKVDIITNGDFMNSKLVKRVISNDFFDRILISAYDGDEQVNSLSKEFKYLIDNGKLIIRKRYLTEDADELLLFSNRTGLVDYGDNISFKSNICFYPFYNIFVDSNGDVILCSHDWKKEKIFGNIYNQDILDIWFSEGYKNFRNTISEHGRKESPCASCNVDGRLYGQNSYKKWIDKPW